MLRSDWLFLQEQEDQEWKFGRSRLWLTYFERSRHLPNPLDIIPTPWTIVRACKWLVFRFQCNKVAAWDAEVGTFPGNAEHFPFWKKKHSFLLQLSLHQHVFDSCEPLFLGHVVEQQDPSPNLDHEHGLDADERPCFLLSRNAATYVTT